MIKFYGMEFTYYDHPDKYSLVLYCIGCNLKCYGCHNRHLAGWKYTAADKAQKISIDPKEYMKELANEDLKMAVQNELIDMVILCGGEMLIYSVPQIKETVDYIKSLNSKVLIRIDTNGIAANKVKELCERGKVDGFAMDIKGPYREPRYQEKILEVIGLGEEAVSSVFPAMIESIHLAKKCPYTIFRTVLYPIITDSGYFDEIKKYMESDVKKSHHFAKYVSL